MATLDDVVSSPAVERLTRLSGEYLQNNRGMYTPEQCATDWLDVAGTEGYGIDGLPPLLDAYFTDRREGCKTPQELLRISIFEAKCREELERLKQKN